MRTEKDMTDKILYIHITSFRGVSIGAIHFYGQIEFENCTSSPIELTQVMDEELAEHLREAHSWEFYKAGSKTQCFITKNDVIKAGKDYVTKNHPNCLLLLVGNSVYAEPHHAVAGKSELVEQANTLYAELSKLDKEKYSEKKYLELCRRWDKFIRSIEGSEVK